MPSEIPAPWSSGLTQARIMKTLIPEKNRPNTSKESTPDSKSGLIIASIFCGYKWMQVSVSFSCYISLWALLPSPLPQNVCCTFGGSSRFPVQLKQVQKLQPGDSENDGEGKQGKVMAHLFSGKELGLMLSAAPAFSQQKLGARSPSWDSQVFHHHSVPRAWIISQDICGPGTSHFIVSSQKKYSKIISACAKAAGKATNTTLLKAMATCWLLQWDADFILEHFFWCLERLKKPTQQQQKINPNKPTKSTSQTYWGTNWLFEWAGLLYWWLWIKQTNCWNKKKGFLNYVPTCKIQKRYKKPLENHNQ